MHYTVYKITNLVNDKIYVGIHKTENLEDDYMGSGNLIVKAINKYGLENFKKEYLAIFDNPEEMYSMESEIVDIAFVKNSDNYNITCGGIGSTQHFKGTVMVVDSEGKRFRVSVTDPRFLSGDLVHQTANTVMVRDKEGNVFRVPPTDFRYISGELIPANLGYKHTEEVKKKLKISKKGQGVGSLNSQYGTAWICNHALQKNKRIKKEDIECWLKEGWVKGRTYKYN